MKKIIFSFVFSLIALTAFCICAFAGTPTFSAVKFVDESGNVVTSYPAVGSSVYANVTINNISDEEANIIFLAGCYNSEGVLENLFSLKKSFSASESNTVSLKIDIAKENLTVVVNAFLFDGKLNPCIKNATMLKDSTDLSYIKINGQKFSDYTSTKDDYSITINTPQADVAAVAKDATTSVSVKKIYIPGVIKVNITSQFGSTRTICIDCNTTNKADRPIIDEHLILKADYNDNTGRNIFDETAQIWTDISGYGNDIALSIDGNNKWTDSGFLVSSASESSTTTVLPQKICDAINSYNFTLQFALANVSTVSSKKCPVMSSPNENFAIYIEKDSSQVYCKFGIVGTSINSWKLNVTSAQLLEGTNTIVADSLSGTMKWYVNDVLISEKSIRSTAALADSVIFSDLNEGYGGKATFKSISVYDRALSAEEIEVAE